MTDQLRDPADHWLLWLPFTGPHRNAYTVEMREDSGTIRDIKKTAGPSARETTTRHAELLLQDEPEHYKTPSTAH